MNIEEIRKQLWEMQDLKYRELQVKIIPSVEAETIIGVRTPELKKLAAKIEEDGELMNSLPHKYFEENQLHSFVISRMKDYDRCIAEVNRFLPYVDNWATCDQMSPKVFAKHRKELLESIKEWIGQSMTYTVRFAIGMLMSHFLDGDFKPEYLKMVAEVRSRDYYVRMMVAWYFATALAKQYEAAVPFIEKRRLDRWTHNKAIQKSVESYRITPEQKAYLKELKWKEKES
ncbi:MAG: DNA alkylation repair protein [Lachnospiraceae bacterium]|nr:DNA alkylation repair protein [Lachnospiraceae bacterium]